MAKRKGYVTEDGCYLDFDTRRDRHYVAWYLPDEGDFGGYIGDTETVPKADPDKNREDWEAWMAHTTVQPLADGRDDRGFYFESERKVRLALRAADEALLGGVAWPEWALRAKEAGWTPPKGWKP